MSCFKISLKHFDLLFQTELIRCKETDSLFFVLKKMREKRVGMVSIEAADGQYTVGLCFLNDLFYLLRLTDYYYYLSQPVIVFLRELNSFPDNNECENVDSERQLYVDTRTEPVESKEEGADSFHSSLSSEEESTEIPFF